MLENIIYKDSHVHIGSYQMVEDILKNTKFINKYRLYASLNTETIKHQDEYLKSLDDFMVMPIVMKEINIEQENQYVKNYVKTKGKGLPVILIDTNEHFSDEEIIPLAKEHFLLHNENEYTNRTNYYEYLNQNDGFLILHCKDRVRINYIKKMKADFPNLNIIVAHLGRNVREDANEIRYFIEQFKSEQSIFFDISTISDVDIIKSAVEIVGSERILYGSDFPYEFNYANEMHRRELLENALYKDTITLQNIGGGNFDRIKKRVYKPKL